MSKNATYILHGRNDGPERLKSILENYGFEQTPVCADKGELDGFDVLEPDLLIVMGGPQGAYELDEYPFLKDEIELIKKRLEAKKPILGICLGAQLMVSALGSRNYKGEHGFEAGWKEIHVTEAGKNSPARHLDASQTKIIQWHQDTFDLPDSCVLLAENDLYRNQIFSYGDFAMGLQGHPEMNEKSFERRKSVLEAMPDVETDFKSGTAENMPIMDRQFRLFMKE